MNKEQKSVLATYEKLHAGKLGAHWLWVAIERISAGEREQEVMEDYGYKLDVPNVKVHNA